MSRLLILCLGLILLSNPTWARTWTSSSGKYRVEAEFVEMKDGKAVLRRKDGTTVAVPLARLSAADRVFVAERVDDKRSVNVQGGEAAIREGLTKATRLEFVETPLQEAIWFLREFTRTEIILDDRALRKVGIRADAPVSIARERATLSEALDLILKPLDLMWDVRHEVVIVTTKEDSESNVQTVVYQVAASAQVDQVVGEVTATVAPSSWVDVGGQGSIKTIGRALVISQTRQVHVQIASEFNKYLRPVPRSPLAVLLPELGRQAKVAFVAIPLRDALERLREDFKVAIELDEKSLEDVGINAEAAVTINVEGISVQSALGLLLWRIDPALTWMIDNRRVIVTTRENAEKNLKEIVYDVRDLAKGGDLRTFIDLVATSIAPSSWNAVGGPASIRNARAPRTLAIAQTVQVHLEIDRLFKDLRKLGR